MMEMVLKAQIRGVLHTKNIANKVDKQIAKAEQVGYNLDASGGRLAFWRVEKSILLVGAAEEEAIEAGQECKKGMKLGIVAGIIEISILRGVWFP